MFVMIGALIGPSTGWSDDYTMSAAYPGPQPDPPPDPPVVAPYDWGTATNWTPNTGFPNDPTDNATVNFSGSGAIDVDLGTNPYTVDTLSITGGAGSAGDFRNGTLNVSTIKYTSGSSTIDFESNLTVDAGTNLLTLETPQNMWLYFYGPVQGSGGMKFGGNGANGGARFTNYQITGDVELAANTDYAYLNFAGSSGATQTISSLTIADNDPFVIATGGSSSNKFTLEIAGATTVDSAVTYAKYYAYAGASQVTLQGPVNFQRNAYCQLHLNGTGGGVLNVNGGLTTAGPSQTLSIFSANGTININAANPWSTRTGTTWIDGGAVCKVNLDAPDVLGSGNIDIRSGGELRINFDTGTLGLPAGGYQFTAATANVDAGGGALVYSVEQSTQPAVTVSKFNAIGGYVGTDITSGSHKTTLEEDAVLIDLGPDKIVDNGGAATALTRAALGISEPTYWKAVNGTHDSYTVGSQAASVDDPDNIYKGMAFTGSRNPGTYWSSWYGDLNALPGEKLQLVVGSDVRFQPSGTTKTELNAYDANKTVDIFGAGYMYAIGSGTEEPIGGNWEVMNRIGETNAQSFTLITFDRYISGPTVGPAPLPAGKTVNFWDGRARIYDVNAVEGTLTINDGATIYLDRQPTTGTFNINAGGAIWMNHQSRLEGLTLGATLNVSPDALLVLYADMNTAANANLNQVMRMTDIVIGTTSADVFSGNGIVLGDGKRLMTGRSYSITLSASSVALAADTGATEVGLASMPGRTLDINCPVNLAGVDLTVGSATDLTTVYGGGNHQRYLLAPTGNVTLDGNVTCEDLALESGALYLRGVSTNVADVTVNAGNLYIGDGTGDVFKATGNMTVNGGWARLNNIAVPATKLIDGNVTVNSGGTFYCGNTANATDTLLDGLIASDIIVNDYGQLRMEVNAAANGGVGPFVVTQKITITGDAAHSPDGAQLWHDIQGDHSGPRTVHYNDINLAEGAVMGAYCNDGVGHAAVTLAGNATVIDTSGTYGLLLLSVASDTPGTGRTLTLGQAGDSFDTTLGVHDSNGSGLVGTDVTLDLVNASLTLGTGGQIDGSLIARAGSSFTVPGGTRIIGGDLSVLAGSTVNFSSADVTVAGILSGDGTITGPVTVSGSVGPGLSPGTLTTGSLTLLDDSHLLYELDAPGTGGGNDLISVQGDLDVDDGTVIVDVTGLTDFAYGTYTLMTYTGSIFGGAGNFEIGSFPAGFGLQVLVDDSGPGGTVLLSSIPEPSTLLLLLLGAAGLFGCARRRRR